MKLVWWLQDIVDKVRVGARVHSERVIVALMVVQVLAIIVVMIYLITTGASK